MPAPHLIAGALCTGLATSLLLRVTEAALPLGAAALVTFGLAMEHRRLAAIALAMIAVGWWWGSLRLEQLDRSVLAQQAGQAGPARVEVTGPPRRGEFAVRVPVRVLTFARRAVSEPARLELPRGRAPPQGAVLELVADLRLPHGPGEGSFDEAAYLRRQGVHVVLRARSFRIVGRRAGLGGVADGIRRSLDRSLAPGLMGERRAVIAGVVLGEDEGLSAELRERFRASGLYHLLAVSGQNVAYVVVCALLLAWAAGLPRWAGELGALAAVGAYLLAVGWQPSVVRAGVAGALASLAWLASRPRDRWYFFLAGAAVLLGWNPYSLLEPGFQLSFAAVAAIFLAVPPVERRLEGYPVPHRLAAVLAVSVACAGATAPILMAHFGAVPLLSILANALAAPVVAPLLGLSLGAAALDPLIPEAAAALAWLNGWLAAYLAACARLVGGLPHAQVKSWSGLGALVLLVMLVAFTARLKPPRGRRMVALVAMAASLLIAWRTLPEGAPPPPRGLRITVLDVGQGDGILLQVREGAVLVDEGPPEAHVADQLGEIGVRRLAMLVLTHPQRDHVGGAALVLERFPVELVLDPRIPAESLDEEAALAAARRRHVRLVPARRGLAYRLGRLRLRVLWPDGPGPPGEDPNNHAVVLLASYGQIDVLLTADAEADVTAPLRPPPVEILKVAHHGSSDPLLKNLLELTRPNIAVISVGHHNDYGHPAPSTLAALRGLALYRTDRDGRVTIETDGVRIAVRQER